MHTSTPDGGSDTRQRHDVTQRSRVSARTPRVCDSRYWGVGPKTRETLVEELGRERAIRAIESGDVRALADAGLARGRATRILRRATGGDGMETLATSDARSAYKELLDLAVEHAVTQRAADRIRVLTPSSVGRQWSDGSRTSSRRGTPGATSRGRSGIGPVGVRPLRRTRRERTGCRRGGDRTARGGRRLRPFAAIADLEQDRLEAAAEALAALEGNRGRVAGGPTENSIDSGTRSVPSRIWTPTRSS